MKKWFLVAFCLLLLTGWKARTEPPHIKRAIPTADILLDAGHGGVDGGTSWHDVLEKDINLAIAKKLYLLLRGQGFKVVLNRTGDYALSDDNRWHGSKSRHRRDLTQRRGLSDEIGSTLFVSIHVNWASSSRNRGAILIHQSEGRSALLAALIQDSLNQIQGRNQLPKPAKQFYLLNRVLHPSVIVETGFISNPEDRAILTSIPGQNRIAAAIANGIMGYYALSP